MGPALNLFVIGGGQQAVRRTAGLEPLHPAAHVESISSGFERSREFVHFGSSP